MELHLQHPGYLTKVEAGLCKVRSNDLEVFMPEHTEPQTHNVRHVTDSPH